MSLRLAKLWAIRTHYIALTRRWIARRLHRSHSRLVWCGSYWCPCADSSRRVPESGSGPVGE